MLNLRTAGDLPGHEFHGNQWTDGGAGFTADISDRYPIIGEMRAYDDVDAKRVRSSLRRSGRLNADGTTSLYHVTLSDPDSILDKGLVPSHDKAPGQDWQADHSKYATYFFLDKSHALDQLEQSGGGSVVEARVPITRDTLSRFVPDEDSSSNIYDGVKVLKEGGAVAFIGGVPAHAVKIIAGDRGKKLRASEFRTLTPLDLASLLLTAKRNVMRRRVLEHADMRAAAKRETAIHTAADRHVQSLTLAVMYAFLMAKRAYKGFRAAGDFEGHPFRGNQWTEGPGGSAIVYHGTSRARLDSIMKEGIRADRAGTNYGQSTKNNVFLSTSEKDAEFWGGKTAFREHQRSDGDIKDFTVLRIEIPKPEIGKIRADKQAKGDAIKYKGDIKPEWIKGHTIYSSMLGKPPRGLAAADSATDAALKALRLALSKSLPPALHKAMVACGEVAVRGLRTLGDVEGHPFHGNQWTSGAGSAKEVVVDDKLLAVAQKDSDKSSIIMSRIENDAQGVIVGGTRSLDDAITRGDFSIDDVKEHFSETRAVLRKEYGDDIILHRVDAPADKHNAKTLTVYMGDKKLADRFGTSKPYKVKTDEVVAVYARKSGYYEFIVEKPKTGLRGLELRTLRPGPKKKIGPLNLTFDAQNARAAKWATEHAAWLIDSITRTTREKIQEAVARAQIDGDLDAQYDSILEVIGDEKRANVIARHESMTAAAQGQREGWSQAVDAGLLPAGVKRVWIITAANACKEICVGLEDKEATLDGQYIGDDGETYDGPPAHVQCGCTEGLSF